MKVYKIFFAIMLITAVLALAAALTACASVDKVAQIAAEAELIDQGTANSISLSARAFEAATERITPEQEYYIGRAVAANILASYGVWDRNSELLNYLNLICASIVANSPRPALYNGYHVAILDSSEINAFATSGGHIFLTRGLICAAKSEEALAAVIAHEIAHIQLQHSIKSIKTNRITKALLVTAQSGVENITGMEPEEFADILDESAGEIMQTMVNSGYSREQEYEADIAAMFIMAGAGYNPGGLIEILEELNSSTNKTSRFNRTHPSPSQRIYFAGRMYEKIEVAEADPSRRSRFERIVTPAMPALR